MTKYFHLIPDAEWEAMKTSGMTWAQCAKEYSAPDWCDYPDAVDPMGCWSLIGRMVTGKAYCKSCDCYKPNVKRRNLLIKLGWYRLVRFINRFRKQPHDY